MMSEYGVKRFWAWGAMASLACAGCGVDHEGAAPQGAEGSDQWGVEQVEDFAVSQVGINPEDPNVGWACDLPRCTPRLGDTVLEPRVGTCTERGWVVEEDGSRRSVWTRDMEFDATGRLVRAGDATYTYEDGLLVEIVEDVASTAFAYDASGRLTTRTEYEDGVEARRIEYTHDARGRLTSRTEIEPEESEPSATYYTYPNDATKVEWTSEETEGDDWFMRTAFDALGRRDLVIVNHPAYGFDTSQYLYEDGLVTAFQRIGDPATRHYTVDYDDQGRPTRIGSFIQEGYDDHGVITREEGLITLEIFTTRTGTERPEYVYALEGDACERGTIEGEDGWLSLVRRGLSASCGPTPCIDREQ